MASTEGGLTQIKRSTPLWLRESHSSPNILKWVLSPWAAAHNGAVANLEPGHTSGAPARIAQFVEVELHGLPFAPVKLPVTYRAQFPSFPPAPPQPGCQGTQVGDICFKTHFVGRLLAAFKICLQCLYSPFSPVWLVIFLCLVSYNGLHCYCLLTMYAGDPQLTTVQLVTVRSHQSTEKKDL